MSVHDHCMGGLSSRHVLYKTNSIRSQETFQLEKILISQEAIFVLFTLLIQSIRKRNAMFLDILKSFMQNISIVLVQINNINFQDAWISYLEIPAV